MNTSKLFILSLILISGCHRQRQAIYTPMLSDIKLGMHITDVESIHNKNLTPISSEIREGYDLVQYRGWFNDGTIIRRRKPLFPYKFAFELYPPLTKIQCQYIAAKNNITDPNELNGLYSNIGLRQSKLIQITLDESALHRDAINNQTEKMERELRQIQLNQILYNNQYRR